jgi:hypothetical protein
MLTERMKREDVLEESLSVRCGVGVLELCTLICNSRWIDDWSKLKGSIAAAATAEALLVVCRTSARYFTLPPTPSRLSLLMH